MRRKSYRANNPVSVLDTVVYDGDNPIGMKDGSVSAGTPREPRRGGCYKADGSAYSLTNFDTITLSKNYIELSIDFKSDFTVPSNEASVIVGFRSQVYSLVQIGAPIAGDTIIFQFRTGLGTLYQYTFDVTGLDLDTYHNYKMIVRGNGSSYTSMEFYVDNTFVSYMPLPEDSGPVASDKFCIFTQAYNLSNFLEHGEVYNVKLISGDETLLHYKCDENSGTTCYNSAGNGYHGTIYNAITTTPEENPNSIHQYQDVYSYPDEVGFTRRIYNASLGSVSITPLLTIPNEFTLRFSFNTGYSNAYIPIFHSWNTTTVRTFLVNLNNFRLQFAYTVSIDVAFNEYSTSLLPNTNYDIVLIKTSTNITIEANGIEIMNKSLTVDMASKNVSYYIAYRAELGYSDLDLYSISMDGVFNVLNVLSDSYLTSNNLGIFIPRDESITLPPFKDVLGNDLQYVGSCPAQADFVESPCLLGDGVMYLSGDILTTDVITAGDGSSVPTCTIDGRLDFVNGEKYYDITIIRSGEVIAKLPLCEPIVDAANHTYFDIS